MQSKNSVLASALLIVSIVSAQSDSAASSIDGGAMLASALDNIYSAAANPSLTSAFGAVTVSPDIISSQGSAYLFSAITATASLPLPSFVNDLSSSVQGPISSYYVGAGSVISSIANASGSGSMTTSASGSSSTGVSSSGSSSGGSSSTSGSSTSGSSTTGAATTSAPSKSSSSGSSSATSASVSAKASNGAVAQHPGTFVAAAAGALGFAALL